MQVRLINMTAATLYIEDEGGEDVMALPPGKPVPFMGEIAGPKLRRFIREGKVQIEDEPPGLPPVD
jgi:hypothetical protein